jgi:hypothetical protein
MKTTALLAALVLLVQGCTPRNSPSDSPDPTGSARPSAPEVPAPQTTPFINVTTIRELMDSMIDPAADGIWDSVATVATLQGVEERQPRTDEDWGALRSHAVALIESPNLLMIQGRHAAPMGTPAGAGELAPEQIERRISENRPAFNQFARALSDTGRKALIAIDQKDVAAVFAVGGEIDRACEACHLTFWYPAVQGALGKGTPVAH